MNVKQFDLVARPCRRQTHPTVRLAALAASGLLLTQAGLVQAADKGLVAHEWGTFTSLQGGDGQLQGWKPLETSNLPGFVYDWNKPGFERPPGSVPISLIKSAVVSKQRMETPVVYFYSDKPRTLDVLVKFPLGAITEWYPRAIEAGPSAGTALQASANKDGWIHWSGIHVQPSDVNAALAGLLPADKSGSHYYAARETDASTLQLDAPANASPAPQTCGIEQVEQVPDAPANASPALQTEKFLFYRGVGNFETALRVTMKPGETLTLANQGAVPLRHLFILKVTGGSGDFTSIGELPPHGRLGITPQSKTGSLDLAALSVRLGGELSAALVAEGLYPREAAAMVNTWKDSWFTEQGTRVLYVLPREWTDATLPMKLTPKPEELTRVMVGRAEILTPAIEEQLFTEVNQAKGGDAGAVERTQALLRQLGRFAEPALGRAMARVQSAPEQSAKLYALLWSAQKPAQ